MQVSDSITPHQMKNLDSSAQKIGISSLVLMENAGRATADEASALLAACRSKKIVCVCGKGNNGGDGFVAARHLINRGNSVDIFLAGNMKELKKDAKINEGILKKMGGAIRTIKGKKDLVFFAASLKRAGIVIDAIFGIGFSGDLKAPYAGIVSLINKSGKPVLAVDVPSGLDALTGKASDPCIRAVKTVTFAFAKTGLITKDARKFVGDLKVADISIPRFLLKKVIGSSSRT